MNLKWKFQSQNGLILTFPKLREKIMKGGFQSQNGLILTQTGHICCKQFHTFQSQNGLILTHLYDEDKCSSCVISIPKWSYFNLLMRTVTLSTRQISIPKWSYFNSSTIAHWPSFLDFNPKMVLF